MSKLWFNQGGLVEGHTQINLTSNLNFVCSNYDYSNNKNELRIIIKDLFLVLQTLQAMSKSQ